MQIIARDNKKKNNNSALQSLGIVHVQYSEAV